MSVQFTVKDSGERKQFESGMVRDTEAGKVDYSKIYDGPMADRWADHLTKGAVKYPDLEDGTPNWMRANGAAELRRFRKSAVRHFRQWLRGDRDECHASAVFFNINGYEYTANKMAAGVPVIASRVEGVPEAIRHCEHFSAEIMAADEPTPPVDRIADWPNSPGTWERLDGKPRYRIYRTTDELDREGNIVLSNPKTGSESRVFRTHDLIARKCSGGTHLGGSTEWRKVAD